MKTTLFGFVVIRPARTPQAWGDPTWFPVFDKSLVEKVFIGIDKLGGKFDKGNVIAVLAQKPY
ncbi:MAG: hypothetical protein ACM34K_08255 [Bacillota bacterium]